MERTGTRSRGEDVSFLAAEEKREFLSRLLARMAHEIRNPLSSLDIHVQLVEEDLLKLSQPVPSKVIGRFDVIRGELRRLDTIVEQFLRLASPSSLKLETVALSEIVTHVTELLKPEAEARKISFKAQISGSLPSIRADRAQLTQALLNVLINALQAVEKEGRIEVHARRLKSKWLEVAIQDSGPGIPIEKKGAIFEPYFSTKRDGSGIGLWIAQQIALAHGGDILVSDAPSGGAVFTFVLRIDDAEGADG